MNMTNEIHKGMIEVDSVSGKLFGFTSDKFDDFSYLWYDGDYIWISVIEVIHPDQGHFSELVKTIQKAGYGIKVPNPFPRMEAILQHYGFQKTIEYDTDGNPVDVWVLKKYEHD